MPELPEVERARSVLEAHAVGRSIERVTRVDEYVCRPHDPRDVAALLTGATITAAERIGKSMWLELAGTDDTLGLHLGMSGRIIVDGEVGGDPRFGEDVENLDAVWTRLMVRFADGGYLALFDKRRLARAVINPDLSRLGPDALAITRTEFRDRIGRGSTAIKARLLNQHAIAGVGNLLADQVLWEAGIAPQRMTDTFDDATLDELRRVLLRCTRTAMRRGGVHTGSLIEHRRPGGVCPRCGTALMRATVGGRTTWWCPAEQR